jgi:outer membrane protein assembly factor BamB
MVECQLPKLEVAGSSPVIRSNKNRYLACFFVPSGSSVVTLQRLGYYWTFTSTNIGRIMRKMTWIGLAVIALLAMRSGAQELKDAPYGKEVWKATFGEKIIWQELTPLGSLMICTDDALFCIDPATGKTLWESADLRKIPDDYFEILPSTPLAVALSKSGIMGQQTKMRLINLDTGQDVWDSKQLGLTNTFGQYLLPRSGALLIYGTDEKFKNKLVCAELETGAVRWESKDLFKGVAGKKAPAMFPIRQDKKTSRQGIMGNQLPLEFADGTFIEFWSGQGMRRINSSDGSVVWTSNFKFKMVPAMRNGYTPWMLSEDGQTLYCPVDQTMQAINVADGTTKWAKGPTLKGATTQMTMTPQGLVVKGMGKKAFINALNPETGVALWKKPFRDLENASSFEIQGDKIVLFADGSIHKIDIASGSSEEHIRKIKLSGDEIPDALEIQDSGYLLVSSNNLKKYDFEGKEIFHSYHKAPGATMFNKIMTTALVTAVNAASAAAAYDRAMQQAYTSGTGRGEASYTLVSNPVLSKRMQASTDAKNYLYILTNIEGGSSGSTANAGLVKVSKLDGGVKSRVALGTKKPEYTTDSIDGKIYFRSENNEITCYEL